MSILCLLIPAHRPVSKKLKQDSRIFASQPPISGILPDWRSKARMQVPNSRFVSGSAPPTSKGIPNPSESRTEKEISKKDTNVIRFGGLEDEDKLAKEDDRELSLRLMYSDPLDVLSNARDKAERAQRESEDGDKQGDQDEDWRVDDEHNDGNDNKTIQRLSAHQPERAQHTSKGREEQGDRYEDRGEVDKEYDDGVNNETVQRVGAHRPTNEERNDHDDNDMQTFNTSRPRTTNEDRRSKPSHTGHKQQVQSNAQAHATLSGINAYSRPPQSTQQAARTTSQTHWSNISNKRNVRPLNQPPVTQVVPQNMDVNKANNTRLQQQKRSQRRKFRIEDLPDGSQQRFRLVLTPLWIDYISTLEGPWDASDYVDVAKSFSKKNDYVYALLMQRAYDYRSGFADRAELAVASYLEHEMPDDIKDIVGHLALTIHKLPGDSGKTRYINPGCYPYMWKEVNMVYDDQGKFSHATTSGAFLHQLISDMFAHHLEAIQGLSKASRMKDRPRGALALACVGVGFLFATFTVLNPDGAIEARFLQQLWGITTDEIMMSISKTTLRGWKNIIKAAIPYIGAYKSRATSRAALKEQWEGLNGYVICFDLDSASDSGSDFSF
ncbi:uncharacterized protein HD556DRAFT_1444379 [Suillus plorans]|uniref:Uncharacterized protein n=1 Tax=Suillus plorans TaxID=116603 RepID=A0A9P7AN81_9AGAM|nr:uncharacterized protein HD556DRAFT_1444379 [Suillus plorans]KAG1792703.1 hypothetical protein HD556DRAFT_1444379 [Suillus plorans]